MVKFRRLLTGRFPGGKNISTGAIRRERLAAAMAAPAKDLAEIPEPARRITRR